MNATARYIRYLKNVKGLIAALILISTAIAASLGLYTYLLSIVYDKLYTALDTRLLARLVMAFLALICGLSLLNIQKGVVIARIRQKLLATIRHTITGEWMEYEYEYFVRRSTSALVKRIVDDCQSIANGLAQICSGFSNLFILILFLTFFLIFMNWLFLIYLFVVIFIMAWSFLWRKPIEKSAFKIGEEYGNLYRLLWAVIPGIKMIKLEQLHRNILANLLRVMKQMQKHFASNTLFNNILWNINYPLPWIAFLAVLFYGAMKVQAGDMTLGILVVCLMFCWRFIEPLNEMILIIISIQEFNSACSRVNEFSDGTTESSGQVHFKGLRQTITFRDAGFTYSASTFKMDKINLTIRRGEKIAFIGKTGSGKTTLANLLLRLFDATEGNIFIDQTDIREYVLSSLREQIILVPQDTTIYTTTLRKNIDLKSNLSDEEIYSLAEKCNLLPLLSRLPEKLDTIMQENGTNLSGGEKQRVSIAKALALKGSVYIFDEITANLDPKTEEKILSTLYAQDNIFTSLTISHNLNVIGYMDRLFTVSGGMVKEIVDFNKDLSSNRLKEIYAGLS